MWLRKSFAFGTISSSKFDSERDFESITIRLTTKPPLEVEKRKKGHCPISCLNIARSNWFAEVSRG